MWILPSGKEVSPVYLYTQLFSFQKHLQYKPMDRNNMMITAIGVPIVENIWTFRRDQKLGGNDLSFVNVLFILEMDTCFISGILLGKVSSPLSVKLNIFRDCIKLKLFIFEYDLLKPTLYSGVSVMGSTFSLLLDGRTEVIAFDSQPLGR